MERMRHTLGHRLLNVASGIKAASDFLARQLDDRLSVREREYFPLIRQQCDEVCSIVGRMNQLFGHSESAAPQPLHLALSQAIESIHQQFPDCELHCEFSAALVPGLVDSDAVRIALQEAVQNALESSNAPILIAAVCSGGECALRVIDQGSGFDSQSAQLAFEMFYTTRARSMGLGLAIAKKRVVEQGGRVALGREERGNFVEFILPVHGGESTAANGERR